LRQNGVEFGCNSCLFARNKSKVSGGDDRDLDVKRGKISLGGDKK